ncbi:MAG: nitrilase family protein [Bacteroidales bacterium]|nr:nitrilase family protein [Bacteroidales bacterium]MBR5780611.1 nitrilase family protein [Bacteroidales bacterium]
MTLKIACVQSDIIARNPSENFKHLDELFTRIHDDRDIIILPETFTTGFPAEPEMFAETEDGPTMTWLRQKAKERNCVICGSFITSFVSQQDDKITGQQAKANHNTLVWMNPDGTYHAYNKRHTFMGGEKEQLCCGQNLITINYKGWKIRPFICYDLRFPAWLRNRYKDGDFEYDLAILIANWPVQKSYIWNTLLSARAIENQAYYIGVNRVGIDHNNISYIGETKVVNGKGRTVAGISDDKEGILEAEIDMESLTKFRNYFTVHRDWDDFRIV